MSVDQKMARAMHLMKTATGMKTGHCYETLAAYRGYSSRAAMLSAHHVPVGAGPARAIQRATGLGYPGDVAAGAAQWLTDNEGAIA